jgi:MinD superfamily P-loop ATPase
MKQLAIISGKGGTGKTTLAAAFASLAENAVLADCDVDAADLHLILKPEIKETIEFSGSKIASKDEEKCIKCGKCREYCRFDAINEDLNLVEDRCEGCGVCEYVCPEDAITLRQIVLKPNFYLNHKSQTQPITGSYIQKNNYFIASP